MTIEHSHTTPLPQAKTKIDSFLNNLIQQEFPAGVKIKDPQKSWSGNRMHFSFKAKKGFLLSVSLSGTVDVSDRKVVLNSSIPGIVTTFVSEDKIRDVISAEIKKLLP